VFPAEFLTLLETLGIDPAKDGEVYHNAQLSPGRHHYGGWFHFVGTLDEFSAFKPIELGQDFSVTLCPRSAPNLSTLNGLPLVQLEFVASAVPWRIPEPEAL
jgi:hypothetical protein